MPAEVSTWDKQQQEAMSTNPPVQKSTPWAGERFLSYLESHLEYWH